MSKIFIVSTHALFSSNGKSMYGTGSAIEGYLKDKKIDFLFIKHSLIGNQYSSVEGMINAKVFRKIINNFKVSFLPLKTLKEFKTTLTIINNISKERKKSIDVFIGIDPLNAFYGIVLRKLGKVKTVIFYTADYATNRFSNSALNYVYHWIDRYAIKNSDQVWNVSTKIVELRKRQGVEDDRNFFVPNSPEFNKVKRLDYRKINKHEIVIVSTISASIALQLIFEVISGLSEKYPDIKLKIIGISDWSKEFRQSLEKLNIIDNVVFLPSMNHESLLKQLCISAIGLALYTNVTSWTKYCDSMKARDYLACGLPVIITKEPSTARDIQDGKAGYVVGLDKNKLINIIDDLFKNKNEYIEMRNNAIALAKKYDMTKILEKIL
jgi:glycosyltransferase involved in cell wall biosynthesis